MQTQIIYLKPYKENTGKPQVSILGPLINKIDCLKTRIISCV